MSTPAAAVDAGRLLADLIAGRFPDARGRFGPFGGRYVPETLMPALERLERGVREQLPTRGFKEELAGRSEEHTSELQSQSNLVCRLLLEKKKKTRKHHHSTQAELKNPLLL